MRALVQRVNRGSVSVEGRVVGEIGLGVVVLPRTPRERQSG